ncbi:MAG: PIG-L family deacetylase [Trueperaceae bacterium]|nr:PIG-L family deacetylase [Trueperaceae bacterium]
MTDLLLIVPHPDDEVFGCGGTFVRMAAHGKKVATLTLTRGGAGRSLGLCSQAELPNVREQELRGSLAALAVSEAHIWDYPDYVPDANRGMEHRDGLQAVPEADIVGRIADLILALKPRSILTFAPNGSNGHPDHVYTHLYAMKAIEQSGHKLEKLYYFASERPYAGEARAGFLAPQEIAARHLYPTHFVHLETEIEAKLRAMGHHRTQALSVLSFMQYAPRRLHVESFHQAYPELAPGEASATVLWL